MGGCPEVQHPFSKQPEFKTWALHSYLPEAVRFYYGFYYGNSLPNYMQRLLPVGPLSLKTMPGHASPPAVRGPAHFWRVVALHRNQQGIARSLPFCKPQRQGVYALTEGPCHTSRGGTAGQGWDGSFLQTGWNSLL